MISYFSHVQSQKTIASPLASLSFVVKEGLWFKLGGKGNILTSKTEFVTLASILIELMVSNFIFIKSTLYVNIYTN